MTDTTPTASFSRVRQIDRNIRLPTARKKSAIKRPTFSDIIFHRRNFPRTQYYLSSGHEHLGESRNVNEEQSPFTFPSCSQMFAYFQYWKAWKRMAAESRRKASYKEQHSYKSMQSRDILQRLRVDVEIEAVEARKHKDLDKAIAITDIDPQYFTELSEQVVKEKFSLRQYVEDTREILMARLLAAQEKDDCIRIDQQFYEEQKKLNSIKRRYRQYVSGFEEFLSKDHEKSMKVLEETEKEVKLTSGISQKRNQLSKEYGQVRLDLYFWEESWRLTKMCQKFLYQVSPISWRTEHDWIHRSKSGESVAPSSVEDIFGRYRMTDEIPLESLIELFNQDVADAGPSELYFKDPLDLIRVFRSMEAQNLNALIHLESLARPMADMTTTVTVAEEQIKKEIDEILEAIRDLEDSITETEKRANTLQEYATYLLRGVFRELICSEDVLKLRVFVEDTYENCIKPNDANLDSFSMMKAIEKLHEELNLQLDNLPYEIVQVCEKEGFRQEMKTMREAEDAARKFELMHRLLDALKRIMEPPMTKRRQLMWRSAPILAKEKPIPPPPQPTEEEMQYLTFFTDYCKQKDFTMYRVQLPDDFDLTFVPRRCEILEETSEIENTESTRS